jgi:hypothetical protein
LVVEGSEERPAFDFYAPLLRLPGIFGTTVETVPANVPYLRAAAELVGKWKLRMSNVECRMSRKAAPTFDIRRSISAFFVGIAWQGNPKFTGDRQRSVPLGQFAGLAEIEGVSLISLQKGPGEEQLERLKDEGGRMKDDDKAKSVSSFILPPSSFSLDAYGAFMDTAAIMEHLDLVITSDSAVAHLAGALGVPVWVALPMVPDWRWLLEREDCPWYPSMRLFRQTRRGEWDEVFERMAVELKRTTDNADQERGSC